jgi:hypothetical protein
MAKRLRIETIRGMRGQTRLFVKITEEFGMQNIETVRRWMRTNKPNGPLTSTAALEIISQALNVPETNLLEDFDYETYTKRVCSVEAPLSGQNCQRNC